MTARLTALLVALAAVLALDPRIARAQRYAVVIGNNAGRHHERALEFAERDASRMADVLTSVGSVLPDHLVLVQGANAETARQALIATNERIRAQQEPPALLVVYYSGHSDAESLHLGDSDLRLSEIEGLVRGSAARLRVLIVDACRSGTLTRSKGGRPAPAIQIRGASTAGDGVIVLAAAAAGEDAQESPDLGGSFFTHHLLSGLLGAADSNRDGAVSIAEVYKYAYANTLRDSSATLAGSQHPTYRYDIRGQGEVVLTELRAIGARAQLVIPPALDVLVMQGSAAGAMIAEARTPPGSPGTLSVPAGRLFVRARAPRALFEQELVLHSGQTVELVTEKMDRIELARLARKGGSHAPFVTGLGLAVETRSGIADRHALCTGVAAHASLVYRSMSLVPRFGACRERFANHQLDSVTSELQLALGVNLHRDLGRRWSVYLGPELGASYFRQTIALFSSPATTRSLVGGTLTIQGGGHVELGSGFSLMARLAAHTYFLELQNPTRLTEGISAVFAWAAGFGVTRYF